MNVTVYDSRDSIIPLRADNVDGKMQRQPDGVMMISYRKKKTEKELNQTHQVTNTKRKALGGFH